MDSPSGKRKRPPPSRDAAANEELTTTIAPALPCGKSLLSGRGWIQEYKADIEVINQNYQGGANASAKAVWQALQVIENGYGETGTVTAPIALIQHLSAQSRATVKRRLQDLQAVGLLEIVHRRVTGRRDNDTNLYRIKGSGQYEPGGQVDMSQGSVHKNALTVSHNIRIEDYKEDCRTSDDSDQVRLSSDAEGQPRKRQDKDKTTGPPAEAMQLAERLAEIVRTTKRVKIDRRKLKAWAADIDKLQRLDGVDFERQEIALDWYQKSTGGEYIPVIESGRSWREKITKLEDAMSRTAAPAGPAMPNIQMLGGTP